jgi:two-component system, OmpR family, alkaline phosphatase synthesis response regulator PhoP
MGLSTAVVKKILIVDNEAHIRILLSQALQSLVKEGVKLFTAENGQEALKLIDLEHPDLVFLDLMMPGLHGFDLTLLIKSSQRTKNIYIIILTARSQSLDRQMGDLSGADEYVVKPFDPLMIAQKARAILGLTAPVLSNVIPVTHSNPTSSDIVPPVGDRPD